MIDALVNVRARRFALNQVRLTNGDSKHAQEINRRYLIDLDPDRLLHSFRITAGLPSQAEPLGGWEEPSCGLRGHFAGHYLSACAQMYVATGDEALMNRAQKLVDELATCQAALKSGYLSAFPASAFDELEEKHGGVWAPYYTMHKIMAGLLDVHVLCDNEQALTVLEKMVCYFKARMDALPADEIEKILHCDKCNPQNEYGGMNDVLYDLYAVTGNKEHLEFAHLFDRDWFLGPLMRGEDKLTNLHGNTCIPIVLGAARRYELTGQATYRRAAEFFWNTVASTRSYVTANSTGPAETPTTKCSHTAEHWHLPNKLADTLSGEVAESCMGHNMLKLTGTLFSWSADMKYADFAERLYLNTVLNQLHPEEPGRFLYHQPLGSPRKKKWGNPDSTFWCCYGTGVEAFSEMSKDIYFHDDETLWVNLYVASQLSWEQKGLRLEQVTDFPDSGITRCIFHISKPTTLTVNLRIPGWAGNGSVVSVNGRKRRNRLTPNAFYSLKRQWKDGDTLELSLAMPLHLHAMPDNADMVAVTAGPVVLAGLSDTKLTYKGSAAQMLDNFKPVEGNPLTFALEDSGSTVTFKPLYRVIHESYGVYIETGNGE
jgi:DUF1680 family protein